MSCTTTAAHSDRTTVQCLFRLAVLLAITVIGTLLAPVTHAEDAITRAIRLVLEENLAASDAEDMPRLLKTMRVGLPNRDLFIAAIPSGVVYSRRESQAFSAIRHYE